MKYEYFVSYNVLSDNGESGVNSLICEIDSKIDSSKSLVELQDSIVKNNDGDSRVIIMNFILLNEVEG